MSDTRKHLVSGTVAGMTAKVVEFPFDTVKVRVQANSHMYNGYVDCAKSIYYKEGFSSFYKGIGSPMAGAALENAVCFAFFAAGTEWYNRRIAKDVEELKALDKNPDLPAIICGGLLAGIGVSFVLTPVELLKCNMQIQNTLPQDQRKYRNVLDCAVKITRAGGLKSMYNGHSATMAREVPGHCAWFVFYQLTKKALTPAGQTPDELPLWKLMFAGGMGGVSYWSAFFPADVVKTKMQIDAEYLKLGLFRGLGRLYKEGGVRALYSGYGITVFRAFPANAIIFSMYEMCASSWDKYFDYHDFAQPSI